MVDKEIDETFNILVILTLMFSCGIGLHFNSLWLGFSALSIYPFILILEALKISKRDRNNVSHSQS